MNEIDLTTCKCGSPMTHEAYVNYGACSFDCDEAVLAVASTPESRSDLAVAKYRRRSARDDSSTFEFYDDTNRPPATVYFQNPVTGELTEIGTTAASEFSLRAPRRGSFPLNPRAVESLISGLDSASRAVQNIRTAATSRLAPLLHRRDRS